jgi:hypothetical protein
VQRNLAWVLLLLPLHLALARGLSKPSPLVVASAAGP